MTDQKQLFYRPDGDESSTLVATIYAPGTSPGAGRVSEVYLDGLKVLLPATDAPGLNLGADVRLALAEPGAEENVNLGARLVERRDVGDSREFVFTFRSAEEIRRKLPLGLYSLLNRRRDVRLRLRQPVPVELARKSAAEPAQWLSAELVSMSASGVGLSTAAAHEAELTNAECYQVRLFAPHEQQPVHFTVAPRNARLSADGRAHYGCEFVSEDGDEKDFERVLDAVFGCPHEQCCGAVAPASCANGPPVSGVRSRSTFD